MKYATISTTFLMFCTLQANAQVYKPADPQQVLAKVAKNLSYADVNKPIDIDKNNPEKIQTRIQELIQRAKTSGDLRYLGYAENLLNQIYKPNVINEETLLKRADIAQYRHDFKAADSWLTTLLQHNPSHAQARLMRATLYLSQGKYPESARDCHALKGKASAIYSTVCSSLVASHQGKLNVSYAEIKRIIGIDLNVDASTRNWIDTAAAEMAERLGERAAAEMYYIAALQAKPADVYVLMQLSDLYLHQQQPGKVIALLNGHINQDGLLLRWVHANQLLKQPDIAPEVQRLQSRMADLIQDNNGSAHLRELTYYQLYIQKNSLAAFKLAQQNWQAYKEKTDLHLLAVAAKLAGEQTTLNQLQHWQQQTGYEDQFLTQIFAHKKG